MKGYILSTLLLCAVSLYGHDVTESLAVDVATQYYERVKNDNPGEHISRIRTNNQTRSDRFPELISCKPGTLIAGYIYITSYNR